MSKLFLAWQDPVSRLWFPVGKLEFDGESYTFSYTQGALAARQEASFEPLPAFPRLERTYVSPELFPLFSNRFLPKSRPDYREYLEWLNIPESEEDPIAILAHSGGKRATDTLEVFPCPSEQDGEFTLNFFVHGARYLPAASIERINALKPGEQLLVTHDLQNPVDPLALMLRTYHPDDGTDKHIVGFLPRYLIDDLHAALSKTPRAITVTVVKVNHAPAPTQLRLMCQARGRWPAGRPPFSGALFQSITSEQAAQHQPV